MLIVLVGIASQYAPGVMDKTIAIRQIPGKTAYTVPQDLSKYDGFVAMESCSELGNEYYVKPAESTTWELFLVVDCSGHSSTSEWMKRNNIIVEVDYETAKRWNTIGKGVKIEMAVKVNTRYEMQ